MQPDDASGAIEVEAALKHCALILRIATGDHESLGMLFDALSSRVHSIAFHMLADADEAEDVVEEVFWQAWRGASRFDASRGSVEAWICMMARSRSLDRLRNRERIDERLRRGELHSAREAGGEEFDPLEQILVFEEKKKVADVVSSLPLEQRKVIELAYFRGLSQSEIASFTGEPLGTVKTRVRLALKKLRDALGPHGSGAV